jgi:hypothetical protein
MSIALLLCGLAVVIQLILGLLVLAKDFRKGANLVFSLQLFLFTLWSLAEIHMILRGVSHFSVKLLMTPAILLSYFFCIFSAIYPEYQQDAKIIRTKTNRLIFFLPAAVLLWLLWSDQLINSFAPIANGFTLSLGRFEFLAKGIVIAYLLYSLSTLSNSRKNAETKIQVRRLRYTFTAMLLPIAAGSIIIAAGKFFIGGTTAYTFGLFPLLSIIMSTMLSYTMLKYNLMEIDLMFSIGLVYTLLTAILAGCMELMQELMQDLLSISDLWTKLISVLVIAAIFSPLKDLLIRLVDHFFGRRSFDSANVMQHILAEMRRCQTVEKMMLRFAQELNLVLDFSGCRIQIDGKGSVCLPDDEIPMTSIESASLPDELNDVETAAEFFRSNNQEDLAAQMLKLKSDGIRHVFPLQEQQKKYGLMLLGGKTSKVPYTEAEINLVLGICREIPFLIENLRMIERLINQDRSLQEIEWARRMLQAISVCHETLHLQNISFAHFSSLSSDIKGDLIDFHPDEKDGFIALYDAFHHGIKAVLTLNIVFSVFRAEKDPQRKFAAANEVLRHFQAENLCSAATLVQNQHGKLRIFTAGNPPPIHFSKDFCRHLADAKTSPLGMSSATSDCEVGLKHGEMLLVSTNGLFKAFAELKIDIDEFLRENAVSAKKCRDRIVDELGRLLKSGFSDDITFLIAGFDDDNDKKN